jgi:hypothetical protein
MLSAGGFEGVMSKVERWLGGRLKDIRAFIDDLYEQDLHSKRVDALAGATLGVMTSASLAVAVIGQALAQARGLVTKHAIKQVDRLLSNQRGRKSLSLWTGPSSIAMGRRRSRSIW